MQIKRAIEAVPGGMMIVPLFCGALLNTFAPHLGLALGSFTGALFTGAQPILAVFFVCMGSTISVAALPKVLRRGGSLLVTKLALGVLAAAIFGHFLGISPIAAGPLAGLSTLAVVAAINDTNGGIYMALMAQYGRAEDAGAYGLMALESGPFFTMLTLGAAGLSSFPWPNMLGAILPLLVGMLLGNLDPAIRTLLAAAAPAIIPFFAFALGATLSLQQIAQAGFLGVALGLCVLFVSAACLIPMHKLNGGDGTAGMAAATTAGNAAAVPVLIAAANPAYQPAAASATVLVAASVIVTALLAPPLTAWWARRVESRARTL